MKPRAVVVTPAPAGSRRGNRRTALRWARILRHLGFIVRIVRRWRGERADLLVALHAVKSAPSIAAFRRAHGDRPLVVALAGTDVYGPGLARGAARRSLEAASAIVTLQPGALSRIPPPLRSRAVTIRQSVDLGRLRPGGRPSGRRFEVLVLAHLRPVKDPLLPARAVRLLPACSRLAVIHLGRALDAGWARRARRETRTNPRWSWRGEVPHREALRRLARARALVVPSRAEGGANVVSEAIALGVRVLASRIDGNTGLLGRRYPGLFAPGDARALAGLFLRLERESGFRRALRRRIVGLGPTVSPASERAAWARLLVRLGLRRARESGRVGRAREE